MAEEKPRSRSRKSTPSRSPAGAAPRRRIPRARTTPTTALAGDQHIPSDAPADAATQEDVRVRAYYLSLERGESPQDPLHDWLQAERELSLRPEVRASLRNR